MIGICSTMLVTGLCVALAAGAACAEDSPFVGKCAALGEPVPKDVAAVAAATAAK